MMSTSRDVTRKKVYIYMEAIRLKLCCDGVIVTSDGVFSLMWSCGVTTEWLMIYLRWCPSSRRSTCLLYVSWIHMCHGWLWFQFIQENMEKHYCMYIHSTVDGRNPAPVDMVHIPLFAEFHTCLVVGRISEPSTVCTCIFTNPPT